MQDLKVIGVENGALLAASDDGERYRIAIDEVLQSRLRQTKVEAPQSGPKLSPREVQAHIRSGMSAEDVARLTGAPLDYVQRFEGPILAEREHMVASALSVPVHTAVEIDPAGEAATFGAVIRERLASLGATGERWASWKEEDGGGWVVKLAFTADNIDHDARWAYDARKHSLAPQNPEATTLSQQGELHGGLIPRLRAVSTASVTPDTSRFDSGAFNFDDLPNELVGPEPLAPDHPVYSRGPATGNNTIPISAINRSADDKAPQGVHHTADLLNALRRRRGERDAANVEEPATEHTGAPRTAPHGIRLVESPLVRVDGEGKHAEERPPAAAAEPEQPHRGRRGRANMPSWDEIVFGARTDDDLA